MTEQKTRRRLRGLGLGKELGQKLALVLLALLGQKLALVLLALLGRKLALVLLALALLAQKPLTATLASLNPQTPDQMRTLRLSRFGGGSGGDSPEPNVEAVAVPESEDGGDSMVVPQANAPMAATPVTPKTQVFDPALSLASSSPSAFVAGSSGLTPEQVRARRLARFGAGGGSSGPKVKVPRRGSGQGTGVEHSTPASRRNDGDVQGSPSPSRLGLSPAGANATPLEVWKARVVNKWLHPSPPVSEDGPVDVDAAVAQATLGRGHPKDPETPWGKPASGRTPLHFLVSVYGRAQRMAASTTIAAHPGRPEFLAEVKSLCVSYVLLLLEHADSFPQSRESKASGPAGLVPFLLGVSPGMPLPPGLLPAMLAEIETWASERAAAFAAPLFEALWAGVSKLRFEDSEAGLYVRALGALVESKTLARVLAEHPLFLGKGTAIETKAGSLVESSTLLGPFFSLSPLDSRSFVAVTFGPSPAQSLGLLTTRRSGEVGGTWPSSRDEVERTRALVAARHEALVAQLHEVVDKVVRAGPEAREAFLSWIGLVLSSNTARLHSQRASPMATASEGFFFNLACVMVALCKPFVSKGKAKFGLIYPQYLLVTDRVDVSSDTKMAASSRETEAWIDVRNRTAQEQFEIVRTRQANEAALRAAAAGGGASSSATSGASGASGTAEAHVRVPTKFKFVTEMFFLTLRTLYFGPMQTVVRYRQVRSSTHRLMSEMQAMNEGGQRASDAMDRVERMMDAAMGLRLSLETLVLDRRILNEFMQLYAFTAAWLLERADPDGVGVPLAGVPEAFGMLPEHIVDDVATLWHFVLQVEPAALASVSLDLCISFMMTLIGNPVLVKNPYLRAKFVSVMAETLAQEHSVGLAEFESNAVAREWMAIILVDFYVDIEVTGSHTQFYDKFSVRHDIATIVMRMWESSHFRGALGEVPAKYPESFTRFVNMLLNDATFTLDESLTRLAQIRELEVQREDGQGWSALSGEGRAAAEAREGELRSAVRSYMVLANESVKVLALLAQDIHAPLVAPALADHLATVLNSVMASLVGPHCLELKIARPEQVSFDPRALLSDVASVYAALAGEEAFRRAVVRDERSFSLSVFDKMLKVGSRNSLVTSVQLAVLAELRQQLEASSAESSALDELLDDVPDEFLDPLMATLMRDPVILPSSRVSVDRSTITRHLLSDESDPFNRQPLTLDQVIPDEALKARIEAWIAARVSAGKEEVG
ncbi:ubiquitin conjugation factor E4 [Thecamonas trahens ATCC 50062]|uniref:RING-type E3 ubiquitin transferase n=1 Tax=Thecamonas trahens ATCC 50062 TaxID=461836 RepID=A0A0L0DWB0_THETB|nr:ubiquitin conjugation factor E4 [Thecamonas trahens ATCC 50062]KNC56510.1 ubiquitin conjugation factor E4 [Thecamonas trahens ATCC 50062]|eukprot:XP_013752616.1 ubiquitin conjugation factor E4 [Thecamonas trahens ATCC 50062]